MKKKCFRITGRDMRVWRPDGKVISFWLYAVSQKKALEMCKKKNVIDIESIEEDLNPPWENKK